MLVFVRRLKSFIAKRFACLDVLLLLNSGHDIPWMILPASWLETEWRCGNCCVWWLGMKEGRCHNRCYTLVALIAADLHLLTSKIINIRRFKQETPRSLKWWRKAAVEHSKWQLCDAPVKLLPGWCKSVYNDSAVTLWNILYHEKLTVSQLVKKCPAFFFGAAPLNFIIMSTRARCWARWMNSTLSIVPFKFIL